MPSQDYEEFIAALNAHSVRYLVIGAHAVAFHARPRATKDLDVLLEPTAANARRALAALREFFGGADLGYTVEDMIDPQWLVQLGVAPSSTPTHDMTAEKRRQHKKRLGNTPPIGRLGKPEKMAIVL